MTFEYEGMSDEELETKFAEMFDDNKDSEEPSNNHEDEEQKFEKSCSHI